MATKNLLAIKSQVAPQNEFRVVDTDGNITINLGSDLVDTNVRSDLASTTDAAKGAALVGYKHPGTGGVARTLYARAQEIVSVKDFGAVGDGVTDDTSAIQAAIDYLDANGGGTVLIPRSDFRYKITGLSIPAIIRVKGDGYRSSELLLAGVGATGIVSPSFSSELSSDQSSWCIFEDFSIYCPEASQIGINFVGFSRSTFKNVLIEHIGDNSTGLTTAGGKLAGEGGPANWYNTFINFHITCNNTTGTSCMVIGDTALTKEQSTTWTFVGGRFNGASVGIKAQGCNGIAFLGTTVEGCTDNIVVGQSGATRTVDNVAFNNVYVEGGGDGYVINAEARDTMILGGLVNSISGTEYADSGVRTTIIGANRFQLPAFNGADRWLVNIENAGQLPSFAGTSSPGIVIENSSGTKLGIRNGAASSSADLFFRVFDEGTAQPLFECGTVNAKVRANNLKFRNDSGLGIFTGTSTPEGVVSSDVGSVFLRTDGGASTTFYVKESGTGNTGWVAK